MVVHDHFDGSAHCIECAGSCLLVGDDRAITDLVRWTLEFVESAHKGWMWDFTKDALARVLGGSERLKRFQARAHEKGPHYEKEPFK